MDLPGGRRKSHAVGLEDEDGAVAVGDMTSAAAPSSGGLLVVVPSAGTGDAGRQKRLRSLSVERLAHGGGGTGNGDGNNARTEDAEDEEEEAEQRGILGHRKRVVRSRIIAVPNQPAGAGDDAAAAIGTLPPDGVTGSVWERLGGRNVQRGSEDGQIVIQRSTELDADYSSGIRSALPSVVGNHAPGGISVVVRGYEDEEEVNGWYEEGRQDDGQAMKVRFGHDDDDEEDDDEEDEDLNEEMEKSKEDGDREGGREQGEGRALGRSASGRSKGDQLQAVPGKVTTAAGAGAASAGAAAAGASGTGVRPGMHKIYDLASDPTFLAQAAAAAAEAAAAAAAVGGTSQRSGRRSVKDRLGPRVEGFIVEEQYGDGDSGGHVARQRMGDRKGTMNGDGSGVDVPVQVKEVVSMGGKTESKKEVRGEKRAGWQLCVCLSELSS